MIVKINGFHGHCFYADNESLKGLSYFMAVLDAALANIGQCRWKKQCLACCIPGETM